MKILLDMNLSPQWRSVLADAGHECIHWIEVGSANAADDDILAWAREHQCVVITLDLDLATILITGRATQPSVVQLRVQDPLPSSHAGRVLAVLRQHEKELRQGAIVVLDEVRTRARILPLTPPPELEE
ncbi:MAG: DUF5615 family PIN-like protein [Phycisphaerae bacterium]|nr:DUF5615 family PIN-like protein [Phycisphaerae bacterium]